MIGYAVRGLARVRGEAPALVPEALKATALLAVGVAVGKWVFPLPAGDVGLYARYAQAFLQSGALPREYPPLAVLPMLAALFPDHAGVGVALLMVALALGAWLLLRLSAGRAAAWRFLIWTTPLTILALTRYDLAPVLCATAGVIAITRGRFTLAHLFLALGALLKIYPLVLVPIALTLHLRRDGPRRALGALALGWAGPLALLLLLVARQPAQATTWLQIMAQRPIQLESVPATLSWVASLAGIVYTQAGTSYYAYSYTSLLDPVTEPILTLLRLVGLLWLYLSFSTRSPEQLATAAVALLMVTNQSLSPQYVLWLLPLAALAALPPIYRVALGFVVILTALDFPVLYHVDVREMAILHYSTALLATIAIRNLVLVSLAVGLIVAPDGLPARVSQAWRLRMAWLAAYLGRQARLALIRALQAGNGMRPAPSQARIGRSSGVDDREAARWWPALEDADSG